MADYVGRLASADFEGRVSQIRAKLGSFPPEYLPIIDREDDGILDRMQAVLDHVLVVTSAVTSELIPKAWITDLVEDLDAIDAAIAGLDGLDAKTITVPLVDALSTAVEETARELMAWPLQPSGGDWRDSVTQAASTYRRSLGQQLGQIAEDFTALKGQISRLHEQMIQASDTHAQAVASRHDELEASIAEADSKLTALESQRATVEGQLARSIERADQAIAAQQQQFSEAQEQRAKEFRTAVDDVLATGRMSIQANEAEAEAAVKALQEQVSESAELVSVFAAAGTANAYSKEAQEQSSVANTWRLTAIVLAIGTVVAAGSLLFAGEGSGTNWELVIGKLAVAVALGGVAAYSASQSGRHRRREENARQLELTIAAFGPFVRELDEGRQSTAREKVVEAIFTREIGGRTSGTDPATLGEDQINILGKLLELLRK